MKYLKKYLPYFFFTLLGIFIATGVQIALAQVVGNPNYIHACVGTGVLNRGQVRIIDPNGTCRSNETNLNWLNPRYVFSCDGCDFSNITQAPGALVDFSNSWLRQTRFYGANLPNFNFSNSYIENSTLNSVTFTGANFINTVLFNSELTGTFSGSNFTGANLKNAGLSGNFDNTNFTNADLTGAGAGGGFFGGAIWSNTICPDGTNSDNNGNTCEGHLTP